MSDTSSTLRCRACGGELGSHFLWTGDGFSYHHECFPSSPKEDEAASLRAQVASLQKELAERTAELAHWHDGAKCGCRYDKPDDVCVLHSPAVAAEKARADTLARRVEVLETALDDMLSEYGDKYDSECRLKNASELDMIARARAALQQTEGGNG